MQPLYIARDGETLGPYSEEQMRELVRNGHFDGEDLAWREGMPEWARLGSVLPGTLGDGGMGRPRETTPGKGDAHAEAGFFSLLPGSFVYPFRGSGVVMLVLGAGAMTLGSVAAVVPVVGWFVYFLVIGYFVGFLFDVIRGTAMGENEMPYYPGMESIWDGVVVPFVRFIAATLLYLVPAIVYSATTGNELLGDDPVGLVLFFGGLFFVPMAILRMGVFNNVIYGLNPVAVFMSVMRVIVPYLIVLVLFVVLHLIYDLGALAMDALPPLVRLPILVGIGLYVMIVQARLLGVIYRTKKSTLGWLE